MPTRVHEMNKPGDAWRVHMAGVGGMGIGVVGAILVRAGHKEGYHVVFADKKGLAIRNGGVYSQITFVNRSPTTSDALMLSPSPAPSPTARPICCWASTFSKPPAPSIRASSSASPRRSAPPPC